MSISKIRSACARLVGLRYRELPGFGGDLRQAIEETLAEFGAQKLGESGSPAYEVNNEYFRIGGRKIRICTEDEMEVSLWGSKSLVDAVYFKVVEKLKAKESKGV